MYHHRCFNTFTSLSLRNFRVVSQSRGLKKPKVKIKVKMDKQITHLLPFTKTKSRAVLKENIKG